MARLRVRSVVLMSFLAFSIAGCTENGQAPSVSPGPGDGGALPPIPKPDGGNGTGGTGGFGGAGGSGGSGPQGACDNADDLDAIDGAGDTMRNIASDCWGSPACTRIPINMPVEFQQCVSDCVEDSVDSLSAECASCYGFYTRCARGAFCDTCQILLCSLPCENCLNRAGCLDALEACTGLPTDDCL